MKKWDDEALFEKAIFLSSQNGQSVSDNVKDLKRAKEALGLREKSQWESKPNTVVVDRGLLRDVCSELGELISLLGDDDERRRKIMLSLSFALNKDR